ncbi:hypothetical protein BDN72DRAFT_905037 [Pluteus cervinus]|uniref:Uncharacterized protein n=1 Tax=Pluteus cervinus TaxID=181527 RepID=A0ACD3A3R3_9AGAR|nr:hypothetical protein BDN72DRAFT_905037 [Pluteus cervinus]
MACDFRLRSELAAVSVGRISASKLRLDLTMKLERWRESLSAARLRLGVGPGLANNSFLLGPPTTRGDKYFLPAFQILLHLLRLPTIVALTPRITPCTHKADRSIWATKLVFLCIIQGETPASFSSCPRQTLQREELFMNKSTTSVNTSTQPAIFTLASSSDKGQKKDDTDNSKQDNSSSSEIEVCPQCAKKGDPSTGAIVLNPSEKEDLMWHGNETVESKRSKKGRTPHVLNAEDGGGEAKVVDERCCQELDHSEETKGDGIFTRYA